MLTREAEIRLADLHRRCARGQPQQAVIVDAPLPGPDGRPYPALAQHALREGRQLARNVMAVVDGREPKPFIFRSLGTMAALGHRQAVAQIKSVMLTGILAWWLRRTYYLLQMPRWERRLRIVLDWTVALFFRPDITKVDLATEKGVGKDARSQRNLCPEHHEALWGSQSFYRAFSTVNGGRSRETDVARQGP